STPSRAPTLPPRLPLLAPDFVAADLESVLRQQVLAHFREDEVAQLGRNARGVALEARNDRARIELLARVDMYGRLPGSVAGVDAVVIGTGVPGPRQGVLVELDVVVELEPSRAPRRVLPGEQVEVVVLEPAAPERGIALLHDLDLAQGIGPGLHVRRSAWPAWCGPSGGRARGSSATRLSRPR